VLHRFKNNKNTREQPRPTISIISEGVLL
jgi:hypothetical protein